MARSHVIISGTGRAGTTFLVQLLTELGLDTGFANADSDISANCNAGMERDLRADDAPYIVKSPWLCDYLDEVLTNRAISIEHAIIPVRDLYGAAESRRDVSRRAGCASVTAVNGGLWHTNKAERQEDVLAQQLYRLVYAIAKHDIPMTLLHFPRLVHDAEYVYGKIKSVFHRIDHEDFMEAFRVTCRPELVHAFEANGVN